jgi:hypothetical protein
LPHRAIKTWIKNGKENGGEFNIDDLTMADYYDPLDPGRNKVIDMGLIKIPVCKIEHANYRWGLSEGEFYPC